MAPTATIPTRPRWDFEEDTGVDAATGRFTVGPPMTHPGTRSEREFEPVLVVEGGRRPQGRAVYWYQSPILPGTWFVSSPASAQMPVSIVMEADEDDLGVFANSITAFDEFQTYAWKLIRGHGGVTAVFSGCYTSHEPSRARLIGSIEEEPVEDGVVHPGEQILNDAFAEHGNIAAAWLSAWLESEWRHPGTAAAILKLAGRQPHDRFAHQAEHLIRQALEHEDIEVRDAAVYAIEHWEDPECTNLLYEHLTDEPEEWLRDYMRQVLEDLS